MFHVWCHVISLCVDCQLCCHVRCKDETVPTCPLPPGQGIKLLLRNNLSWSQVFSPGAKVLSTNLSPGINHDATKVANFYLQLTFSAIQCSIALHCVLLLFIGEVNVLRSTNNILCRYKEWARHSLRMHGINYCWCHVITETPLSMCTSWLIM